MNFIDLYISRKRDTRNPHDICMSMLIACRVAQCVRHNDELIQKVDTPVYGPGTRRGSRDSGWLLSLILVVL